MCARAACPYDFLSSAAPENLTCFSSRLRFWRCVQLVPHRFDDLHDPSQVTSVRSRVSGSYIGLQLSIDDGWNDAVHGIARGIRGRRHVSPASCL